MKKLEASSNITRIETRSLSSVTPKDILHRPRTVYVTGSRLGSGNCSGLFTYITVFSSNYFKHFLVQSFQSLPHCLAHTCLQQLACVHSTCSGSSLQLCQPPLSIQLLSLCADGLEQLKWLLTQTQNSFFARLSFKQWENPEVQKAE